MERQAITQTGDQVAHWARRNARKPPLQVNDAAMDILLMQQSIGNQAVQRRASMCAAFSSCPTGGACHTCPHRVQTIPRSDQPADEYEQEAERVADAVVHGRLSETPERIAISIQAATPVVQRAYAESEEEMGAPSMMVPEMFTEPTAAADDVVATEAIPDAESPTSNDVVSELPSSSVHSNEEPHTDVTQIPTSAESAMEADVSGDLFPSSEQANERSDVEVAETPSPAEAVSEISVSSENLSATEAISEHSDTEIAGTPTASEPATETDGSGERPPSSKQAELHATVAQEPPSGAPAAAIETGSTLIVADSGTAVRPGQMRKSEFLAEVRAQVTRTVEEVIAPTGRSTNDCPYLDFVFDFFAGRSAQYIDRTLRQFAPEFLGITTARDAIPIITARVHRSADVWVRTGQITGLPLGVPRSLRAAAVTAGPGPGVASPKPVLFKAHTGGARTPSDPQSIQSQLGSGRPLDGSLRSRMEAAFGYNLSHVRMHTDATARQLSSSLNARAFTVGEHVAFASGEYRPGTVIGDALIAHELAHVVQQNAAVPSNSNDIQTDDPVLEEDADRAAMGAVASVWAKESATLKSVAQNAMPRLRSGLRLARCRNDSESSAATADGCVTGNLTARTSGSLQGGWSVNDYLTGGLSWGTVSAPRTAGRDGRGFKVQIVAPYSGRENLGVSQTIQMSGANQQFRDTLAAYLGQPAGSVRNGDVHSEPVLDASDPFASTGWVLRYKDGMVSFADVPRNMAGSKGSVNFDTSFHSKGTQCTHSKCSVRWVWTIDFTAGQSVNTVTQGTQSCT